MTFLCAILLLWRIEVDRNFLRSMNVAEREHGMLQSPKFIADYMRIRSKLSAGKVLSRDQLWNSQRGGAGGKLRKPQFAK